MLRPWIFVGFTGHRRIEDDAKITKAIQDALDDIAVRSGTRLAAVSSVASGADTLFGRVVVARNLPWDVLLPLPKAEFARDFSKEDWQEAEQLMAKAIGVEAETAWTGESGDRDECYLECGVRTVDACDVLVAVWNGDVAAGRGGTADVVAHARQVGRPLVWIHSETGLVTWERADALPTFPEQGAQPMQVDDTAGGRAAVEALRDAQDALASRHAPEAKDLLMKVILLHLVATALALLGPILGLWFTIALGLVVLKIAMLVYADHLHHKRQHSHEAWLHSRILAELSRGLVATWNLPYSPGVHAAIAVPGFRRWQRSLGVWRRFAPPVLLSLEETKKRYLEDRVTDQLNYFRKHLKRAEERHQRAHHWATWATRGAIGCGLVVLAVQLPHLWHLIHEGGGGDEGVHPKWEKTVKWLSLVLPLVSAAVLSISAANDHGRRVVRNREMVAFLERAEERMARVTTWGGLERLAADVEQLLMLEILEWHSVARFGGEGH